MREKTKVTTEFGLSEIPVVSCDTCGKRLAQHGTTYGHCGIPGWVYMATDTNYASGKDFCTDTNYASGKDFCTVLCLIQHVAPEALTLDPDEIKKVIASLQAVESELSRDHASTPSIH